MDDFEYIQRRYHKCVSMIVKHRISAYFNLQFDRKMRMYKEYQKDKKRFRFVYEPRKRMEIFWLTSA